MEVTTTAIVDDRHLPDVQALVDVALIQQHLVQMDGKLDTIQAQTIKTNGRVNDLESWRDQMKGAWLAVSVAGPVITGLIVGLVLKLG